MPPSCAGGRFHILATARLPKSLSERPFDLLVPPWCDIARRRPCPPTSVTICTIRSLSKHIGTTWLLLPPIPQHEAVWGLDTLETWSPHAGKGHGRLSLEHRESPPNVDRHHLWFLPSEPGSRVCWCFSDACLPSFESCCMMHSLTRSALCLRPLSQCLIRLQTSPYGRRLGCTGPKNQIPPPGAHLQRRGVESR